MPRAPMSGRRRLLIVLGLLQLGLWLFSWGPYFIHYVKAGEQRIWGAVEEVVDGLERERWLVERERDGFATSVDGLIYEPVSQEIYRTREMAWLPIVSLGCMGVLFLLLALLPDRWRERRRSGDESAG